MKALDAETRQTRTRDAVRQRDTHCADIRRAFSLTELIIVLSVTVLLTGILMPALRGLQEHAERMISQNNQRQIGMGISMYATDHDNDLPRSELLRHANPGFLQEMMALWVNDDRPFVLLDEQGLHGGVLDYEGWDGVGRLYQLKYINIPNTFYCPSHAGDHPLERYEEEFQKPTDWIYSNYHYRGDIDVFENRRYITLERDNQRVLLTDGMRTKRDLNHKLGYNSLLGDLSVFWTFDSTGELWNALPDGPVSVGEGADIYEGAWDIIDGLGGGGA